MEKATLVASLKTPRASLTDAFAALPEPVAWVDVCADRVGDLPAEAVRQSFRGGVLYTLRSRAEGGHSEATGRERHARLLHAAATYDLVDLEAERDLTPELLRAIPPEKRLISWHGPATDRNGFRRRFEQMAGVEARFYKLVSTAEHLKDGREALAFLKTLGRADVTAFAEGRRGFWSRLLAPHLKAPLVFGSITESDGDEPAIARLIQDYGLPNLMPVEAIYGIVGNPVIHSLSPRLHNAAYRALGHRALYLPFEVDTFEAFWREIVEDETLAAMGFPIGGLTVVSPFKAAAQQIIRERSPVTQRAVSSNLYLRKNGIWIADTTDAAGILTTLGRRGVEVQGRRVAIIGCGGSGRAMAAALDEAGARVTLVNRGLERGFLAVQLLDLPFAPLSSFSPEGFAIVVNATPVGRHGDTLPFAIELLDDDAVVVDLVYGAHPTLLVDQTRACGRSAIEGREMLVVQVMRQFALMTGRQMPEDLIYELAGFQEEVPVSHA